MWIQLRGKDARNCVIMGNEMLAVTSVVEQTQKNNSRMQFELDIAPQLRGK